jgi:hypothetical protein
MKPRARAHELFGSHASVQEIEESEKIRPGNLAFLGLDDVANEGLVDVDDELSRGEGHGVTLGMLATRQGKRRAGSEH